MNEWFKTLDGLLETCWSELKLGVAHSHHPARNANLATVDKNGLPKVRTVVLRRADQNQSELDVHTDLRSDKISDLRANPVASLLFWLPDQRLQLRLSCQVAIESGSTVRDLWNKVPQHSRVAYGSTPPPGTPIDNALSYERVPNPDDFAVLVCQINEIDVLHLGDDHRRARYTKKRDWDGEWLAP